MNDVSHNLIQLYINAINLPKANKFVKLLVCNFVKNKREVFNSFHEMKGNKN